MTQGDPHAARPATSSTPHPFPAALVETGKQRVDDIVTFQTECLQCLEEASRTWFARMQSEAAMTSEFATKLGAARSVPEATAACQDWTNRHIELLAQDGQRLYADTKRIMEAGARILANGWASSPNARP